MTTDRKPRPRRPSFPMGRRRALPPRRPCDRCERQYRACLLVLLAAAPACVPYLAGRSAYDAQMRTVREQSASRHQITVQSAGDSYGAVSRSGTRTAPVRWTDGQGVSRMDFADVPSGTARGERVRIWVDAAGGPTRPPLERGAAVEAGWFTGAVTAALLVLVFLGVRAAVTVACDRRRYAHWAAQWEIVEPQWSRRLPT
ncbi:Rv1733c family protein [Streptomyces klenkii]